MTIWMTIATIGNGQGFASLAVCFWGDAMRLELVEMRQAALQLAALQDPDRIATAGGVYALGV